VENVAEVFPVLFAAGFAVGRATVSLKRKKNKENSHRRSGGAVLVVKGVEHFLEDETVARAEPGDFFVDGEVFVVFPAVADEVVDGDAEAVGHFDEELEFGLVEAGFIGGDGALFEAEFVSEFFLAPVAPFAEGLEVRFPLGWVPFGQNRSPSFRLYYNT
jgi:hypothetical protein